MALVIKIQTVAGEQCSGPFPESKLREVLAKAKAASVNGPAHTVLHVCKRGRPSKLRVYERGRPIHLFQRKGLTLSMNELQQWVERKPCGTSKIVCKKSGQ